MSPFATKRCVTPGCTCLASYSNGGVCANCRRKASAPPPEVRAALKTARSRLNNWRRRGRVACGS